MWCVADLDAEYITPMEDVLALNERPYDATAPVVCLDEKPVRCRQRSVPIGPPGPPRQTGQ